MTPWETLQFTATFTQNAFLRGATPRALYLEVTRRCNARCGFCNYWKVKERGELSDYLPIVEKFRPFLVSFTGGEPLLRRDLARLVASVRRATFLPYTVLLSNGWLLSPERAAELRAAGLNQVQVSVDFLGAQHDRQRGLPGLFARIERWLPAWQRLGFDKVSVNTVVMEANLDHVLPIARWTAARGVDLAVSAYAALKTGDESGFVRGVGLERLRVVIAELKRLKREQGHITSSDFYLDRIPEYFAAGGRLGARCTAAGQRFFHVDPYGYLRICPEFGPFAHWTEVPEKATGPIDHGCTRCWYACRGENEAPLTVVRLARDLRVLGSLRLGG